ncbi:MAG: glycoside hydrolase family 3 C-terminal domain-containing protein [Bacilli bacterium]|nr:glycoside hydrolase family 3 C-terminal domain-containing protein [Bacilli bacterium]
MGIFKPKLWLGLTATFASLFVIILAGNQLAIDNEGLINNVLNPTGQKIDKIDSDEVEGSAYVEEDGSLSNDKWRELIKDTYKFCEEAEEQGTVLLRNDNDALPLKEGERKVTLLGQGSRSLYMRSGAGGAAPNDGSNGTPNLVVKMDKAFEANGFTINHEVFDKYTEMSQSNMTSPDTKVEHTFSGFYTDAMKNSFKNFGDAAIITFVRIGTEDTDPSDGILDLNNDERQLLQMVSEHKEAGDFKKVIVIINSPLPMSMDWAITNQYGIDAVLYIGVPGFYGIGGVVHVLMGKDADGKIINPSGHLPDTFAASASSSPAYVNFNRQSNNGMALYAEGVYVGYKYYETRYADGVMNQGNANGTKGIKKSTGGTWNYAEEMGYPFGYGMSYTSFEQKINKVSYNQNKDTIDVEVEVKNTGEMDGKSSIQVYVSAPYTDFDKEQNLGKSAIALMAYDKVDVKAGETVKKTVSFDRYFLCTYDYKVNKTYILEGGTYYFALGNGAHEAINNVLGKIDSGYVLVDHNGDSYTANLDAVKTLEIQENKSLYSVSHYNETPVTNQFDDADYNYFVKKNNKGTEVKYLDRSDWEATYPTSKNSTNPTVDADSNMSQYYNQTEHDDGGLSYTDGKGIDYDVAYPDGKIKFEEMSKVPLEGEVTNKESRFYGEDGAEIWDAFIKQMDLDDLIISVSDNRGIMDVLKVLKKGNGIFEGPEGLLAKFQYGDKRWATGFPTGPTITSTFDHEMQKKYGGFYGEEAVYCGVACVNAPGANINRTPYGSRASEYASEDGIMNYNIAANIVGQARRKGLIMNIKHCFLNNQETNRKRIFTFCNEQAIREIYLKPFEGGLTKGHSLGIMTSYNRIGARYAACHEPLMSNVMRGEWGYRGQIIDDALGGSNEDNYSNGPAMLHCGTDIFCLDGGRGRDLRTWVINNNDGTILRDLQRANKYVMYSVSRSFVGGVSVSEEEIIESMNPWWKKTIQGIIIGTGSLTAVLFGLYIFSEIMSTSKAKPAVAE